MHATTPHRGTCDHKKAPPRRNLQYSPGLPRLGTHIQAGGTGRREGIKPRALLKEGPEKNLVEYTFGYCPDKASAGVHTCRPCG